MTDTGRLPIHSKVVEALGLTLQDNAPPSVEVALAAVLFHLASDQGLAQRDDEKEEFSWVHSGFIPEQAADVLDRFIGDRETRLTDEKVRNGLYDALIGLAAEPTVLRACSVKSDEGFLKYAQIYWNLDADGRRTELPFRHALKLSNGQQAHLKAPGADVDVATLDLKGRAAHTANNKKGGGAYYGRGACIAVHVARLLTKDGDPEAVEDARLTSQPTGRGAEWSIVWGSKTNTACHIQAENERPECVAHSPEYGDQLTGIGSPQTLEMIVEETAKCAPVPSSLSVGIPSRHSLEPARFLSGATLSGADVGAYAVPRRVAMDGDVLSIENVASRFSTEETVGYLVAGAGEGKSTYLHALASSLRTHAIVFRWRVTGELDWTKVQEFREAVAAARTPGAPEVIPIVVIGELETKLAPEKEDALIEIVQGLPAGLVPRRTSIVLAGRPAWLNRIRYGASTGKTMHLMDLSEAEAEALVHSLSVAYAVCGREKGEAWTKAHFPNLNRYLALPNGEQVRLLRKSSSLVGALLQAVYGRDFTRRLIVEYESLDPVKRSAYLLVSLATSALGGITEELLEEICSDADIRSSSRGSPWRRSEEGIHRARHETIGRLIVEDRNASTSAQISQVISWVLTAATASREAYDLLLNSVRVLDEPRSLVPEQHRKPESQICAAIGAGVLSNRESWERLEQEVGTRANECLALSYFLQRLVSRSGEGGKSEYFLARIEGLLAAAEATAQPDSGLASRARFHRVLVTRGARRSRGEPVDNPEDVRALLPMLGETWPESLFYAQFISVGLSTLRHCVLEEDEQDQFAGSILEAWQRLRVGGDTREQIYEYASFVARDLYLWSSERRTSLWETAWEFSCALGNPDGYLACLLDDELRELESNREEELRVSTRARRIRFLSGSIVPDQDNGEVLLRYAELVGNTGGEAEASLKEAAEHLAASDEPIARSMANHALALVSVETSSRLGYLREALRSYDQSMTNRDDWLTRGPFWKRALREFRVVAPDAAQEFEVRVSVAGRKFL